MGVENTPSLWGMLSQRLGAVDTGGVVGVVDTGRSGACVAVPGTVTPSGNSSPEGIQLSVVWHLEHCPRGWPSGRSWQDLQLVYPVWSNT